MGPPATPIFTCLFLLLCLNLGQFAKLFRYNQKETPISQLSIVDPSTDQAETPAAPATERSDESQDAAVSTASDQQAAVPISDVDSVPLNETNSNVIVNGKAYSLDGWLPDESSSIFPLPKPIIIVGLPKAGTSTIQRFFRKARYKSGHWEVRTGKGWGRHKKNLIGVCMRKAVRENTPLLKSCGNFDVWSQMDVSEDNRTCVFPQIEYLEQIHKESPNATFLLNRRDLDKWASSVTRWQGLPHHIDRKPPMSERLAQCKKLELPDQTESSLKNFHLQHVQRIRQFVKDHPSHALLEIDIADQKAGKRMSTAFRQPEKFWGHANANTKK